MSLSCSAYMSHLHTRANYTSLLQNIVSFIGLFCKRDIKPLQCKLYVSFAEYLSCSAYTSHMHKHAYTRKLYVYFAEYRSVLQ